LEKPEVVGSHAQFQIRLKPHPAAKAVAALQNIRESQFAHFQHFIPLWLMTFTAILPVFELSNGRLTVE
jgi:hypothetical protein